MARFPGKGLRHGLLVASTCLLFGTGCVIVRANPSSQRNTDEGWARAAWVRPVPAPDGPPRPANRPPRVAPRPAPRPRTVSPPAKPAVARHKARKTGTTPGTYTHYKFLPGTPLLRDVTWTTTVVYDPGFDSNIFWSHQFGFNIKAGGYIGMQSNGGQRRLFLFSVWDASQSKRGSPGSLCSRFTGEGSGQSCYMRLNWTAGHTYAFHVAYEGANWFAATVTDVTTARSFALGSIRINGATAIAPGSLTDWTEYFEWNNPRTTCYNQPGSAAIFGVPIGNRGTAIGFVSHTNSSNNGCRTRIDNIGAGTVQRDAVGNSIRGAVEGLGRRCLAAAGGRIDVGIEARSDGAPAILDRCTGNIYQAWVHAADRTLRLVADYCLEANSSAEGAGVQLRNCSGDDATGRVRDPAKLWTYNPMTQALRNVKSGRCLTGGTGAAVTLHTCNGSAGQRWRIPPTY